MEQPEFEGVGVGASQALREDREGICHREVTWPEVRVNSQSGTLQLRSDVRTVMGRTLASRNSGSQTERSWLRKLFKNFDAFSSVLFSPNNYWGLTCSRYYLRHQATLENKTKGSSVDDVVLPQCPVLRTDWQICIEHVAVRAIVTASLTASAVAAITSSDKKQDSARSCL